MSGVSDQASCQVRQWLALHAGSTSRGSQQPKSDVPVGLMTQLLAETDELRRRLMEIEEVVSRPQSGVPDDAQSADSWSVTSTSPQPSSVPRHGFVSAPMPRRPPKYYTVTRTSRDRASMIGIHFCTWDDMLAGLKLSAGPTGKVEDWKGNHCAGFGSITEARKYWYHEGHRKEPPTYGR